MARFALTSPLGLLTCALPLLAIACSADEGGGGKAPKAPTGTASSNGGGTGGESIDLPAPGGGGANGTATTAPPQRCDSNGENCKCIAIANVGGVGSSGTTESFDSWLNDKSNARVDNFPTETEFTDSFLANYDILIIQDIANWTLDPAELTAVETWVRAGGGIMSMNGYGGSESEVNKVNLLLAPLQLAYAKVPAAAGGLWTDVSTWNEANPIASNMIGFAVAIHNGRPVNDLDGTGSVVLTAPLNPGGDSLDWGYTKTIGRGHAFVWADEWVTYSSQWVQDERNLRAQQFWYNSVTFLTPPDRCKVVIDDPSVFE